MATFVKLTTLDGGRTAYLNLDHIECIDTSPKTGGTQLWNRNYTEDEHWTVRETPEAIMKMAEAATCKSK